MFVSPDYKLRFNSKKLLYDGASRACMHRTIAQISNSCFIRDLSANEKAKTIKWCEDKHVYDWPVSLLGRRGHLEWAEKLCALVCNRKHATFLFQLFYLLERACDDIERFPCWSIFDHVGFMGMGGAITDRMNRVLVASPYLSREEIIDIDWSLKWLCSLFSLEMEILPVHLYNEGSISVLFRERWNDKNGLAQILLQEHLTHINNLNLREHVHGIMWL